MTVSRDDLNQSLPAFVGRYKVERVIGRGSFAVVALAWDEELESAVALKILHYRTPESEKRFMEEARMLRRIQSPNVIAVHDIGRLNDGSPYFVLDYASRGTFEERLKAGIAGPMLATEHHLPLLSFIDALADGLLAIHNAGMVHRDIKPANILFGGPRRSSNDSDVSDSHNTIPNQWCRPGQLLAAGERVLVGDLGIAKDLSRRNDEMELLGGTPFYLAPEQRISGSQITPAADIYSATAVLWRALVDETPPASVNVAGKLETLPYECASQGWQSLFEKGMAAQPETRYQTADEWRWAIHDVLGSGSSTVLYQANGRKEHGDPRTDLCPYKGLAAYQSGDSRFFCGRDALVDQLLRRMQLQSVLVVGGPSGSGKSSLVRAGLIPSLEAGALPGSRHWQCLLMTPGPQPMQALRECLKVCGGLDAALLQFSKEQGNQSTLVLVVDQFEEIFTQADSAQKNEFLQSLAQLAVASRGSVKLTLVVRADFYAECAREPWLATTITNNQVLVGPMSNSELRQAISEPARAAGYFLEKGLVSAIIEEAGNDSGSLPLVAHALVETWVRRTDNTMTLEGFRASGGVAGAISQSADATYEHQLDAQGREATRRLMLNLVNPGDGTPDTRRVISRSEITRVGNEAQEQSVLDDAIRKLTTARLLTVDDSNIQIAHEALLRNWPRLRQWIDESRDDLRMRRKINLHAVEWQAENLESDLLYHGTPLQTALEWRQANPDQLGVLENTFLDTSAQRQHDAADQAEQRRQRGRRLWTAAITLLTLLAVGATLSSLFAYQAFRDSQQNARVAQEATAQANSRFAGALGAAAYGHYDEDPRLSLVIASEALARATTEGSDSLGAFDMRASMVSARQVLAKGGPFLLGSPLVAGDALSIALNPQGSILAVGHIDGTIAFFDVSSHVESQPRSPDHQGGVRDLEFSPDGQALVSAGVDGRLLLWKMNTAGLWESRLLGETDDVVPDVDFHPGGQLVMSANHDTTIREWYVDGRLVQPEPMASGKADINALAISQDGRFVVAGNADKTISGWDLHTRKLVFGPLEGVHPSHLLDIVFSPSADSFITMTTDGESKRLSFPDGQVLETLFGPKEPIGALLINPQRREVLGGNHRGELVSWDIGDGAVVQRSASGHSQIIKHASMTGDGRLVATLGRDQIIRFWTLNDKYPMGQELQVDSKQAKSVAISPDGSLLASGDRDGQITLWKLDSNDLPKTFGGHEGQVWALAFSPDGRFLASADRLGKVQIRDVLRRRVIQLIDTGPDAIWSVEFVPDEELFVATEVGVKRYSVLAGELLESWGKADSPVTRLTLSHDKTQVIVSHADGSVSLENVSGESNRKVFKVSDDLVWSAALNHAGTLLAVASSDETVSLINVESGERVSKLTGHTGGATNAAFLEDGVTLVVSDRRGSIHWWDIGTERRLAAPWRGHRKAAWRMALHPDGNRFATAGDDGKVWIWDALSVEQACDIGYSGFDAGQKSQYLGDDHTMLACQ